MGPGEMRSSNIGLWQCEQQMRSVAVKDCGDEGTASPVLGGSITDLPVADNGLADGDAANLAQRTSARLVNIDHY